MSENLARDVLLHGMELRDHGAEVFRSLGMEAVRLTYVHTTGAVWEIDNRDRIDDVLFKLHAPVRSRLAPVENFSRRLVGLSPIVGQGINATRKSVLAEQCGIDVRHMPIPSRRRSMQTNAPLSKYPIRLAVFGQPLNEQGHREVVEIGKDEGRVYTGEFLELKSDDLLQAGWPSKEFIAAEMGRMFAASQMLYGHHRGIAGTGQSIGFRLPADRFINISQNTHDGPGSRIDEVRAHLHQRDLASPGNWRSLAMVHGTVFDGKPSYLSGHTFSEDALGSTRTLGMETMQLQGFVSAIGRLCTRPELSLPVTTSTDVDVMPVADFDFSFLAPED